MADISRRGPARTHPPRRRRATSRTHPAQRAATDEAAPAEERPEVRTDVGGGGSFHGNLDDTGGNDGRGGDNSEERRSLLIALGILTLGAGIMALRLATSASARRSLSLRR